jgi:hypothetical protein
LDWRIWRPGRYMGLDFVSPTREITRYQFGICGTGNMGMRREPGWESQKYRSGNNRRQVA